MATDIYIDNNIDAISYFYWGGEEGGAVKAGLFSLPCIYF